MLHDIRTDLESSVERQEPFVVIKGCFFIFNFVVQQLGFMDHRPRGSTATGAIWNKMSNTYR
jgi:hypothetical protein